MDYQAEIGMDRVGEWGNAQALPFPLRSFDLIHASHVLEHIPWNRSRYALVQAFDLLKPGGRLEIHVPDLDKIVEFYRKRRAVGQWQPHNADHSALLDFNNRVFAIGTGPNDWHKAAFDYQYLHELLEGVGFVEIQSPIPVRGHRHGLLNLSMAGRRPL